MQKYCSYRLMKTMIADAKIILSDLKESLPVKVCHFVMIELTNHKWLHDTIHHPSLWCDGACFQTKSNTKPKCTT